MFILVQISVIVLFFGYAISSPCYTKANVCVPVTLIEQLVGFSSEIASANKVHSEKLFAAGFALLDPKQVGYGFFSNADIKPEIEKRFNESDNILELARIIQHKEVLTQQEFVEWLQNSSSCPSADISKICTPREIPRCSPIEKYRTYDGTCNNLLKPNQGSAFSAYSRILAPVYSDDILSVRKSVAGLQLPNPRKIATTVFSHTELNQRDVTRNIGNVPNTAAVIFGQTIVHDYAGLKMKQIGTKAGPGTQCCTTKRYKSLAPEISTSNCMPINIPKDDQYLASRKIGCMNFVRAQTVQKDDCGFSQGEQVNQVTSYIDGSFVYGSSEEMAKSLRTFTGGLLKMEENILPSNGANGFMAGDARVGQTSQLAFFHSIYFREHNRIAKSLSLLNTKWDDEKLFQETRRIIIAFIQHAVYEEWLPVFMGSDLLERENLLCRNSLYCDHYKTNIDASCLNELTTGPARLLHMFVPDYFIWVNNEKEIVNKTRLSDIFSNTDFLRTNYDDIVRGLVNQQMNFGRFPIELLNYMFRGDSTIGMDLLSMDIQRGRDHGIPSYTAIRAHCDKTPINTFDDLYPYVTMENIQKLKEVYENVHDIDLIVGAGIEQFQGYFTPTMTCLHIEQFKNFKYGDSFFYVDSSSRNPFSRNQLAELKKHSFSNMICANTNIERVPKNAFATAKENSANIEIECNKIQPFNLDPWKEA